MEQIDIKMLPPDRLKELYLELSIENRINESMLNVILSQMLEFERIKKQQAEQERIALPRLKKIELPKLSKIGETKAV